MKHSRNTSLLTSLSSIALVVTVLAGCVGSSTNRDKAVQRKTACQGGPLVTEVAGSIVSVYKCNGGIWTLSERCLGPCASTNVIHYKNGQPI